MDRKIVFLDIDGTVKPFNKPVPQGTKEALRRLMDRGHIPVICTGRAKVMAQYEKEIMDLHCPAMISSAGAEVEYRGQTLYRRLLPQSLLDWTIQLLDQAGCGQMLEAPDSLYCQRRWMPRLIPKWTAFLARDFSPREYPAQGHQIQKLMVDDSPRLLASGCVERLAQHYQTLFYDNLEVVELIPHGINKAAGIGRLLDHLGIGMEDTYAFGDGPNDLEMLSTVHYGVAMGNATAQVKEVAPYITAGCEEDGIRLALERFGLI